MNKYFEIEDDVKKDFISQTALRMQLPHIVVEKDLWVTAILQIVFSLPFADKLLLKGGTSLSKIWNLINRMSEDIDLGYESHFDIFEGENPTIKQIKKLRKQSSLFVQNDFSIALEKAIVDNGLDSWLKVEVQPNGIGDDTYPEPRKIYVSYKTLFPELFAGIEHVYVKPVVMLEIGSRSLIEPTGMAKVSSFVSQIFPMMDTDVKSVEIRTALPQKTFLEKAFLLHELFSTKRCSLANRKSRHLFDLEKMMDKDFAIAAVSDDNLWRNISHHRAKFTPMRDIDYEEDLRKTIVLVPPHEYLDVWKTDYEVMSEKMVLNRNNLPFNQLIDRMHILEARFRGLIDK